MPPTRLSIEFHGHEGIATDVFWKNHKINGNRGDCSELLMANGYKRIFIKIKEIGSTYVTHKKNFKTHNTQFKTHSTL